VIRPGAPADAAALSALHAQCFAVPWSPKTFADMLTDQAGLSFVAARGSAILSALMLRIAADEAEIVTLMTTPATRGKGLARRLLAAGCDRLAERGVRALFLEVGVLNSAARRFYRAAGFDEVGRRAGYYPQGSGLLGAQSGPEDALILRLMLEGRASGELEQF